VIDPLIELFKEFEDVPTMLLVGNHERPDKFSDVCNLGWLDYLHPNLTVVREVTVTSVRGVDIYWLPWTANPESSVARVNTLLQERSAVAPSTPRILLGHGCIDGAIADNGTRLSNPHLPIASLCLPSYNLALFGDIHKAQRIADNAQYVGALHQNRAGEDDNPDGYLLVDDDLMTVTRAGLEGIPRFGKTSLPTAVGHVNTEDGGTLYLRPDETAVIESLAKTMPLVRMQLDLHDLRSMVTKYAALYPPKVPLEEIQAAVAESVNA